MTDEFSRAAAEGGDSILQTFFYRRNVVIATVHVFSPPNTLHQKNAFWQKTLFVALYSNYFFGKCSDLQWKLLFFLNSV